MKQTILSIVSLFLFAIGYSQLKINDYPFGNLDVNVVVIPFGMDSPIKLGTISKTGDINFNFTDKLKNIPSHIKESESYKLWYTLFPKCNYGMDMVAEEDNIFSFDAGALSLWTSDERYVGVIFIVSNEDLMPWVEDPTYMEPVLGSYYKLVYVEKPFEYNGSCVETKMLDNSEAQVSFDYDLSLKSGFNFIEYKIEHIYKTDPNVMASFPDKVFVTSVSDVSNCKWIAKYF